jgi:hypothetical protein
LKKLSIISSVLFLIIGSLLVGCGKNNPVGPKAGQTTSGGIKVKLDVFGNISSGTITVVNGPLTFTNNLLFTSNGESASTSFTDLQTGTWSVTAKLYNASSVLQYYSTGTATVYAYAPTQLVLSPIRSGGTTTVSINVIGIHDVIFTTTRSGHNQLYYLDQAGIEHLISGTDYIGSSSVSNARFGGTYYFGIYQNGSTYKIVSFQKDGTGMTVVKDNSHGEAYTTVRPSWDGTKIAFFSSTGTTGTANSIGVGILNSSTNYSTLSSSTYISNLGGIDQYPVWTADGRIVFLHIVGSTPNLCIMNSDGSGRSTIYTSFPYYYPSDCSASGEIVYCSSPGSTTGHINIDGSNYGLFSNNCPWPRFRNDDQMVVGNSYTGYNVVTTDPYGSTSTIQIINDGYTNLNPCFMY